MDRDEINNLLRIAFTKRPPTFRTYVFENHPDPCEFCDIDNNFYFCPYDSLDIDEVVMCPVKLGDKWKYRMKIIIYEDVKEEVKKEISYVGDPIFPTTKKLRDEARFKWLKEKDRTKGEGGKRIRNPRASDRTKYNAMKERIDIFHEMGV